MKQNKKTNILLLGALILSFLTLGIIIYVIFSLNSADGAIFDIFDQIPSTYSQEKDAYIQYLYLILVLSGLAILLIVLSRRNHIGEKIKKLRK